MFVTVLYAVCAVAIYALYHAFVQRLRATEPRLFQYWAPWFGHTFAFLSHAEGLYAQARRYFASNGPFALLMGGSTFYIVSDPAHVKAVYQNNKQLSFSKIAAEFERTAFGISAVGAEKFWRDVPGEGRLFENAHAFYQQHLTLTDRLNPLAAAYTTLLSADLVRLRECRETLVFPLIAWCQETVFKAGTTAMWGPALLERNPDIWETLCAFDRNLYLLVFQFPAFMCRKVRTHREKLLAALEEYYANIAELESAAQECVWERQHMHERASLTSRESASFNLSVFWGFNLNLVKTASWMVAFIVAEPGLQEQLRVEIAAAFRDDPREPSPTALADLCPLLNAAFDETLRLVSSSTSTRLVLEDFALGGVTLRAGNRILLPSQHLHRDRAYWGADADVFRPERFLKRADASGRGLYRPFGGGTSLCPGRFFARRAVLSFVAILLHLFDVEVAGPEVIPDYYRPRLAVVDPLPGAERAEIRLTPR